MICCLATSLYLTSSFVYHTHIGVALLSFVSLTISASTVRQLQPT